MVLKVGIAGLGTIGTAVARALDAGIEGLELSGVTTRNHDKAEAVLGEFRSRVPLMSAEELAKVSDVVVDCVPKPAFRSVAEPTLRAGKTLVSVSGAAILAARDVVDLAKRHSGRIVLASGAILGLDALRAASEGNIASVTMVTRKPPRSLAGAPYLDEHGIDVEAIETATKLFEGTAAEGARGFPANVNVAAAVGLAGIGADRTRLEIWADPEIDRNTHAIRVEADSASFEMSIQNVPSDGKPGTGKITALSVIATLRGLVSPLKVGT